MFKVSVCLITYNHEKYIAEAIESVLMQQTDFDYELVIGEDCSTDRTREILLKYKDKYPDKVRLLLPERNLGMMINLVKTLKECHGEYIAILEGDDYWTDKCKLQKQVSFFEKNPGYSICFHKVTVHHEYDIAKNYESNKDQCEDTSFTDLCMENYMATASVVYSKLKTSELPDWFVKAPVGDWTLHLFNAQFGKIKFLEDNMAVYRQHNNGIWSTLTGKHQLTKSLMLYDFFIEHFPKNFKPFFKTGKALLQEKLFDLVRPKLVEDLEHAIDKGNRSVAFKALFYYYKYNTEVSLMNTTYLFRKCLRIIVGRKVL